MHFVESWQRLARTGEAGGSFSGKPNIRPISAYFEDLWSFRTSARILVSLLTRRSNERRGEPPGRVRRYISTTCCVIRRESRRPSNPGRRREAGVLGGGTECRGCDRANWTLAVGR